MHYPRKGLEETVREALKRKYRKGVDKSVPLRYNKSTKGSPMAVASYARKEIIALTWKERAVISFFVKMFGKSPPTNENFVFPTIDRTVFFGYNK